MAKSFGCGFITALLIHMPKNFSFSSCRKYVIYSRRKHLKPYDFGFASTHTFDGFFLFFGTKVCLFFFSFLHFFFLSWANWVHHLMAPLLLPFSPIWDRKLTLLFYFTTSGGILRPYEHACDNSELGCN